MLYSVIVFLLITFFAFKTGVFRKSESDILQILNNVFLGNEMIVHTSNGLKLDKVKIKMASSEKIVFINGKFKNNIEESYGGPNFDVYYDEIHIGKGLHDNTNDWYVNEFIFNFFKLNGKVKFNFISNGKNKSGEEGYIWIEKEKEMSYYQSFTSSGELINKWHERNEGQANPSPQLYAIHTDHLGTPQALSNAQQQMVWQAEYASFGQATVTAILLNQGAESNSASNPYGLMSTAQANTQQPSVPPKHFEFNLRFAGLTCTPITLPIYSGKSQLVDCGLN